MWKKTDDQSQSYQPQTAPAPSPRAGRAIATLGPSIVIKGDLTGEEDLIIEGRVQGEVRLSKNSVTVGKQGQIRADIYGQRVHVEGEVKGNLFGEEEVVIRASGRVQGNIVAPRVTLENGSKFKGAIDMEPATAKSERPSPEIKPKQAAPAAAPRSGAATGTPPTTPKTT